MAGHGGEVLAHEVRGPRAVRGRAELRHVLQDLNRGWRAHEVGSSGTWAGHDLMFASNVLSSVWVSSLSLLLASVPHMIDADRFPPRR